jgi:hypothetical protein
MHGRASTLGFPFKTKEGRKWRGLLLAMEGDARMAQASRGHTLDDE